MESYSCAVVALTVFSFVALVISGVFVAIFAAPNNGVFSNSLKSLNERYLLDITPSTYTFGIWGVIYIWQAAWMIYAIVNIYRTNSQGRVLLNPVLLPVRFQLFWISASVLNIIWIFLWDAEYLLASFLIILACTICGNVAVTFQTIALVDNHERLKEESKADLICNYVLIHNGLDLLFSWATVITLLNLAAFVAYDPILPNNREPTTASTISICLLGAYMVVWAVLENTVLFRFARFAYGWYGVLIWVYVGMMVNDADSNANSSLIIVFLCVALICLGLKIAIYFYKTQVKDNEEKPLRVAEVTPT